MERNVVSSHEGLVLKVVEAMDVLGIPKRFQEKPIKVREEFAGIGWANQQRILNSIVYPMLQYGPKREREHSMRVALRGMQIANLLGFDNDAKILKFIGDIYHDSAKLLLQQFYPENNLFEKGSKEFEETMKKFKLGHVAPQNICLKYGETVASIIEQHHRHQHFYSNPYPGELYFRSTPLSAVLSKLLAVSDCEEALTYRPCMQTQRAHTKKEIKGMLLNEYAEMRIEYNGSLLPRINMSGEELILLQEKEGIIGKE